MGLSRTVNRFVIIEYSLLVRYALVAICVLSHSLALFCHTVGYLDGVHW